MMNIIEETTLKALKQILYNQDFIFWALQYHAKGSHGQYIEQRSETTKRAHDIEKLIDAYRCTKCGRVIDKKLTDLTQKRGEKK